jgi:hypothetical protein
MDAPASLFWTRVCGKRGLALLAKIMGWDVGWLAVKEWILRIIGFREWM